MDLNFYPSLVLFTKSTIVSMVRAASMAIEGLTTSLFKFILVTKDTHQVVHKLSHIQSGKGYLSPAWLLNIYSNKTANKHAPTETPSHVCTCECISLHSLGDSHILPKGSTFIKAVTFQYPVPPPAPTVHTHSHHEHANTMMLHVGDV